MTSPEEEPERSSASDSVMEVDSIVVDVDPDGDLILRVGAQLTDNKTSPSLFRVCASAMRRSSAVWKSMLFGPWKESKPASGSWSVDLPEDDPDALMVLLNIVHANFYLVPRRPDLILLEGVLRLANKYDMILALRPWAHPWLNVVKDSSGEKNGRRMLSVVYVARELGELELHMDMMQRLVVGAAFDENGQMVTEDGFTLVDDGSDLFAEIRGLQQAVLELLPQRLNLLISALTVGRERCPLSRWNPKNADKTACDNIILGSIFKAMAKVTEAVTLELVANVNQSVAELSNSIRTIARDIIVLSGHDECNPRNEILKGLEGTLKKWKRPREAKLGRMGDRREDLGLKINF